MRRQVNGITLNLIERKSGDAAAANPTLIFLHYFGGSSRAWSTVIAQLENDYRCIAPDLRGFGDSDAPAKSYTVSDYAQDVGGLVEGFQLEHYTLVGHSMGGKIALAFAARKPCGLASLVLLAPSPPTPEPIEEKERTRLLATFGERNAAEETIRKITAHTLPDLLFGQAIEDNLRSSRAAWHAWLECGSREDISAEMSKVNVPVFMMTGADDKGITKSLLEREVMPRIPQAQLCVLPNAGHLLPLETPEAVASLIRTCYQ